MNSYDEYAEDYLLYGSDLEIVSPTSVIPSEIPTKDFALMKAVNDYRASVNLPPIPISLLAHKAVSTHVEEESALLNAENDMFSDFKEYNACNWSYSQSQSNENCMSSPGCLRAVICAPHISKRADIRYVVAR